MAAGFSHCVDFTGKFEHREFMGVAQVEWSDGLFVVHQGDETTYEITEKRGACLRTVAEDGEGFEQSLLDEGRMTRPSSCLTRGQGVENPCDANFDAQISVEGDGQTLCVAFGFIVHGARTNGSIAPVTLVVDEWSGHQIILLVKRNELNCCANSDSFCSQKIQHRVFPLAF